MPAAKGQGHDGRCGRRFEHRDAQSRHRQRERARLEGQERDEQSEGERRLAPVTPKWNVG